MYQKGKEAGKGVVSSKVPQGVSRNKRRVTLKSYPLGARELKHLCLCTPQSSVKNYCLGHKFPGTSGSPCVQA